LFVDVWFGFIASWDACHCESRLLAVYLKPTRRSAGSWTYIIDFLEVFGLFAVVANGKFVTWAEPYGRNVKTAAVQHKVTVGNKLAGSPAARGEPCAVHCVVCALLKELQQNLTCLTLLAASFLHKVAELTFKQTIQALNLLLLTKL
jgi:hypothetical protein